MEKLLLEAQSNDDIEIGIEERERILGYFNKKIEETKQLREFMSDLPPAL